MAVHERLWQNAEIITKGSIPFSKRGMTVFYVPTGAGETGSGRIDVWEAGPPIKVYEGIHRTVNGALKAAIREQKAKKAAKKTEAAAQEKV